MSESPKSVRRPKGGFTAGQDGVVSKSAPSAKPKAKGVVCINDSEMKGQRNPFTHYLAVLREGGLPVAKTFYERTGQRVPNDIAKQIIWDALKAVGAHELKHERDEKARRTYLKWE